LPVVYRGRDEEDEAWFVARKILELKEKQRKNYNDFSVLYRTHAQSRTFEEIFLQAGIPYQIIGGLKFYDRKEIKDILAYLKIIHNPYDLIAFRRIIN